MPVSVADDEEVLVSSVVRRRWRGRITQVVHRMRLKMFTRLSRANRLVLDNFYTLSQTGKIVRPNVTTAYDGTSREQGRCSRLVNLVNAIGTGCDGGMKSKAPQLSIGLRGSETRGSFRPLQATRLGKNGMSAATAAARGSPRRRAHSSARAPVQWFSGFVPTVPPVTVKRGCYRRLRPCGWPKKKPHAVAPAMSVMKSRRLIAAPSSGKGIVPAQSRRCVCITAKLG